MTMTTSAPITIPTISPTETEDFAECGVAGVVVLLEVVVSLMEGMATMVDWALASHLHGNTEKLERS